LQDIERLKPGDGDRLAVLSGDDLIRARADDGADVAGGDKAVELQVGFINRK
jgi:hypothetical protein